MLEISPEKIAHVIIRAREYDSGVNAWAHSGQRRGHGTETELAEFIAALNEDEQASLVAVMWIGRDTFGAEDLAEAILTAVDALQPGDALLIAGKGHETGQIVGDDILPFDDTEQASVAVAALDGLGA